MSASTFQERMAELARLAGNAQELADRAGISRRAVGKYLAGESDPSRERLIALARSVGVGVEWLATGDGEMFPTRRFTIVQADANSSVNDAIATYEAVHSSLEGYQRAAEQRMLEELGLGELALMATRGHQRGAWHLLGFLTSVYPQSLPVAEIVDQLRLRGIQTTVQEVAGDLAVLLHRNQVERVSTYVGAQYRSTSTEAELKAVEVGDVSQAVTEAVHMLVQQVLPAVESRPSQGVVVNSMITVPAGQGVALVKELLQAVRDICLKAGHDGGQEQVALVLGAGVPVPSSR